MLLFTVYMYVVIYCVHVCCYLLGFIEIARYTCLLLFTKIYRDNQVYMYVVFTVYMHVVIYCVHVCCFLLGFIEM